MPSMITACSSGGGSNLPIGRSRTTVNFKRRHTTSSPITTANWTAIRLTRKRTGYFPASTRMGRRACISAATSIVSSAATDGGRSPREPASSNGMRPWVHCLCLQRRWLPTRRWAPRPATARTNLISVPFRCAAPPAEAAAGAGSAGRRMTAGGVRPLPSWRNRSWRRRNRGIPSRRGYRPNGCPVRLLRRDYRRVHHRCTRKRSTATFGTARSRCFPGERQAVNRAVDARTHRNLLSGLQVKIGNALQPFLEKYLDFGAAQIRTGAAMRTIAEGRVHGRGAVEVHLERVRECALVQPVQGGRQQDHVAGLERDVLVDQVARHTSPLIDDGEAAQQLVHRLGDERGIVDQLLAMRRTAGEKQRRERHGGDHSVHAAY